MSTRVLEVEPGTRYHHHFFDVLKSFFWLILWSVAAHLDERQQYPTPKTQKLLDMLNQDDLESMSFFKAAVFRWFVDLDVVEEKLDACANEWASDPMFFKATQTWVHISTNGNIFKAAVFRWFVDLDIVEEKLDACANEWASDPMFFKATQTWVPFCRDSSGPRPTWSLRTSPEKLSPRLSVYF
ncbi:hypothetical protein RSAG8_02847, partial [Rhizoctonia solani AG-8 WAC10335]